MQVVIKEGELGSLAPLGGDESTIRAQQVFLSSDVVMRDAESWCWRRGEGEVEGVFDKQGAAIAIVKEN